MIVFKYQKEQSALGDVLRPVAKIALRAGKRKIEVPMYIDSGADISMIPLRFGRALGLEEKIDGIRQMRGISGKSVPYVLKTVEMTIGDVDLSAEIAWALVEGAPLLLGRRDIFKRFRIIFDEARGRVEFVSVKKPKKK